MDKKSSQESKESPVNKNPGQKTASKHKSPPGKNEAIGHPKNSGYAERQPGRINSSTSKK